MADDPIEITAGAAHTLARGLYDEARRLLDANGHDAPIARIAVCRPLGDVYVHWVPARLVTARPEGADAA